jgi:glycosyltransferase involved in cell wall biosynthesis
MVSVVVPAYNAASTIRQTLNSILEQTYSDLEIIVADDVSGDGTPEEVESFAADYASSGGEVPIRVVRLSVNGGPAAARNEGVAVARGEWIAFLDADDVWLPWRIEDQFNALGTHPDAVLVCGDITSEWDQPVSVSDRSDVQVVGLWDFVDQNPVGTSTVLVRRQVFNDVNGFDLQFRGPEDVDLWMRVAARGPILKLNWPVIRYREGPGSLSMRWKEFLPQVRNVYRKAYGRGGVLYPYRRYRRRTLASRYVSSAWSCLLCGERLDAMLLMLRSWILWPWPLKPRSDSRFYRLAIMYAIVRGKRVISEDA